MTIRGGFMSRMQSREEEFQITKLSKDATRYLIFYAKNYLGKMLLALLATLAAMAISLSLPYIVKVAVDDTIAQKNMTALTLLSILYLAFVLIHWVALYWSSYLSNWVGQNIVYEMRKDLFDKVLHQSLRFHEQAQVGQISSRITHDINAVTSFISDGAINLIADIITVIGIIIIMALLNWRLTIITLISLPAALISMRHLGKKMRQAYWNVQQAIAEVNTSVEQGIAGMRVVKSLSRESFNIDKFQQLSLQNMKANLRTGMLFAAVFPTMSITNMLGIALVLGYGGNMIAQGQMTVGIMMAFLGYVYRLYSPLRELGLVYGSIQAAAASLDRIMTLMEQETALVEPKTPQKPLNGFTGHIRVKDVHFFYDKDPLLQDVQFEVLAGQTIAFVGASGAGKSTLAKLLARLYDVKQGTIVIDEIDIKEIASNDLRRLVNIITQDVFLFAESVYDNIRYGDPQASPSDIINAAKQAQAHAFISELPKGYQTQVGELGIKLSGGQKQLIAFARAILANPKIFILDEATANVDPHTESSIQKAMIEISQNRTTIIIAHRFSTLHQAEKLLVLDNGKVVGFDSHNFLIRHNLVYQKLYKLYELQEHSTD